MDGCGRAMVLGNFQCRAIVRQVPTVLAVGAGGGSFRQFFSGLSFLFSFSLSVGDGSV